MKNDSTIGCGIVICIIIALALALFLTPAILMLTWNLAVCTLFTTLPAMGYWVAFGINIFLNIIGNKFTGTISTAIDKLRD